MSNYKYIVVEGLVKSGKTRLAQLLSEEFKGRLFLDNMENPYLDEFYESLDNSGAQAGLKTQLIFLLNRYYQQLEINQKGLFHQASITDYIFFRDGIYAHMILNDEELEIYKKIFKIFSDNIPSPDLVIYLQISFSEMMRRIQESGTELEKNIPTEYWREVFEAYNYYFFNYKTSPLLVVNMEKIDLGDKLNIKNLIKEIQIHQKGIRYYAQA